ncbi:MULTISPECIES: efflux RND transporter periplasmic adaptor subunit [Alishewanella]|uniref:Efflux transporter RND family, MFP subunit n=2 Tax=Alishewanella TaxID=111142 RepID=H3ZIB4_9ALTE|nr:MULTISPECIES: efflux RND transporter periplasmic adaptor subunit [Alishewanella]EHR39756.1 Efflux transporter RND family, MFP subunit [Alishewanella jeotgali KCTC 22429]EJI85900.1 Efflux transporter RND family, MFP subunit [Alishewanella aestuarii B11]OCW97572.1 efflux transporter periplasmic adaptor subunit [Alishewanella sp. HH-ZS]
MKLTLKSSWWIASLVVGLSACSDAPQQATVAVPTVKLYTVNGEDQASSRHFVGRIDAVSTVDLAFQVGGRVTELPVQQGQVVPAGELLAALDPADYRLAVEQAEVQLAQASRDLERGKPLREQGILTPSAFDQLQTNFEIARVALENARRNLDYTQLKAPFDALVTRRIVERFATVAAGTPLLRVQNITELRVHINVPEQIMRQVRDTSDYLVSVRLSESATERYPLAYREHATEVDPLTQTYQVSFAMPRLPDVNLLPGMTVNVVTEKVAANSAVLIPVSALDTATPDQFYVWRYQAQTQSVQRVPVQVGSIREQQVEIISGLSRGEQVVSAGIYQLQPEQQVQPFVAY